jgi:hypothetical protein
LSFFVTATAKIPEALPVDTPASTVQSKLPDDNLATITVGKGKVFYDLKGREVRKKALELMGKSMELLSPQKNLKLWFNGRCWSAIWIETLIAMKTADRSKPGVQSVYPDSLTTNCTNGSTIPVLQILKLTKRIANSHQG